MMKKLLTVAAGLAAIAAVKLYSLANVFDDHYGHLDEQRLRAHGAKR